MLTSEQIKSGLYVGLAKAGAHFADELRKRVSGGDYPHEIGEAISLGQVGQSGEDVFFIDVIIDLKIAPMAMAYEYGSGEHATRGEAKKYIIAPREAGALAFEWEPEFIPWGSEKFIGISSKTGKFLFRFVEHPGVERRPYVHPTLQDNKVIIKKMIGAEFEAKIRAGGKVIEVIR